MVSILRASSRLYTLPEFELAQAVNNVLNKAATNNCVVRILSSFWISLEKYSLKMYFSNNNDFFVNRVR
jgi:hypothetical protein